MKKSLFWLLVLVISVSMVAAFSLSSCATTTTETTAAVTTAAATTAAATTAAETTAAATTAAAKAYKIAMIVKNSGNPFFEAAQKGGQEAADQFGDTLIFQAPEAATAEGQISIIEALIAQKVDGIAISANDKDALVPACKKALDAGIKVIAWDSAIAKEGILLFINQADPEQIGRLEVQFLGKQLNYEGDIAILSATAEATNQNIWIGG